MNTLILKILCWINGIKNPFTWANEHEKRNYKSIEHVIDNARFFMESTHELAYDHGYSDGQIEILNEIKAEIEHKANNCEITLGADENTFEWGKHNAYTNTLNIIDKYIGKEYE